MTSERATPARLIVIGFRRWKRYNLAPILKSQAKSVHFVATAKAAAKLHPPRDDRICWWSAAAPEGALDLAAASGTPTLRIEDGFYRSVGLGSDLIPPLSLVLDSHGLYFDPRQPSDLEHILATTDFSAEELEQARHIRAFIIEHGLTKYNLEPEGKADWPTGERYVILVPGQVENDASIRFGCSHVRTNADLLRKAREGHPDAFIVYKPHPDVMSGNRKGRVALSEAARWADHIETDLSVISCIKASDEVQVMTSQAGFDALLRRKKVVTYGQPFYAGWGLTEDRDKGGAAFARRRRVLSLDELVAAAILRYPLYWNPDENAVSHCTTVLEKLDATRNALERSGGLTHLHKGVVRRLGRKIAVLAHAFSSRG